MTTVKATREGELGQRTASGYLVEPHVPFVALPSARALGMAVRLRNPANGRTCSAIVLDVGPWNTFDDAYVFGDQRPQAESGTDTRGRATNGAGIDLGERVWSLLGMTDNAAIEWEFLGGAEGAVVSGAPADPRG
jgi:hypothetical protein